MPKNKTVPCPTCGTPSSMVAEESSVGVAERRVIHVGRNFHCPQCNKIFQSGGHHSTLFVKEFRGKFPKAKLREFRAALSPAEKRDFNETFAGKRMPNDGDVEHWLDVLSKLQ